MPALGNTDDDLKWD